MLERRDYDRLSYDDSLRIQEALRARVLAGGPGAVMLLTHPPTVTLGRNGKATSILNEGALEAGGTVIVRIDRGGDVTWHGPGQLVGYPIVDLTALRLGVRDYVRRLAMALARVAAGYGVQATWDETHPGLWVGRRKLAAFGVHVHRGVTTHGFALNVSCDLGAFDAIVPCGLVGFGVTSLLAETGSAPPMEAVRDAVATALADAFGLPVHRAETSGASATTDPD